MFRLSSLSNMINQIDSGGYKVPIQVKKEPILKGKPFVDETNKERPEKREEVAIPVTVIKKETPKAMDLQEAIVWSELLGKPMCKRRKDGMHRMGAIYGDQDYSGGR